MLYLVCIVLIDPFDFLNAPKLIPHPVKVRAAYPLNQYLPIFGSFRSNPAPYLLLGDSRMMAVKADLMSRIAGGETYGNLAFGGASLKEDLDAFWFADRRIALRKVYLALAYDTYNDYNIVHRTQAFRSFEENAGLYLFNRTVLYAAWNCLSSYLTGVDPKIGVPTMSREEFWKYQVDGAETQRMLSTRLEPNRYRQELIRLAEYCRGKGIELAFVILPTHVSMQQRIERHAPGAQARLRSDLAGMATLLDFDFSNAFTENRENFSDPVHVKGDQMEQVAMAIHTRAPSSLVRMSNSLTRAAQ